MTIGTFKAIDRHGAELDFEVQEAGVKEINEAEMQYRISYSKALSMGILPRDKMIEVLKSHEIWDDELSKELVSLTASIALAEKELIASEKRSESKKSLEVATKLARLRGRMWEIMSIQATPLSHSCEGYAEIIRGEAQLASQIHVKGIQDRYWPTYKNYVIERDDDPRSTVAARAMDFQNNIFTEQRKEILDETPEQKFFIKSKTDADKAAAKAIRVRKPRAANKKTVRKKSGTKA